MKTINWRDPYGGIKEAVLVREVAKPDLIILTFVASDPYFKDIIRFTYYNGEISVQHIRLSLDDLFAIEHHVKQMGVLV